MAPRSPPPWRDYSDEMRIRRNPALRLAFRLAGVAAVGLGILGYLLPGLPGTVFLIVAAYCFAQSSPRLYNRLMNHPTVGPVLRDVRAGRGVPRWVKVVAPAMIVLFAGSSAAYLTAVRGVPWAAGLVLLAGAAGVWTVARQPTRLATEDAPAGE